MNLTHVLLGLGCLAALGLAREDFLQREIHLGWFVAFGLAGLGFGFLHPAFAWSEHLLNLGLVTACLLFLWGLYSGLKKEVFWDEKFGKGDALILILLALWWPMLPFWLFFTLTNLLLVIGFLSAQNFFALPKTYPIPLAGVLALAFCLLYPLYHFGLIPFSPDQLELQVLLFTF